MKLIYLFFAFIGHSAFATLPGYDLKMDLTINGKHISTSQVIIKNGESALIKEKTDKDESFIEVHATEGSIQNHKGIIMNFVIGAIELDGQRIIKAKPQILANENEKAHITVGENNGDEISISVIAKRISL